MRVYLPPSLRGFKARRMVFSTWVDHLPFGYDIVEALRPKMLVELGAYNGLSFFAFCQSVLEHDIECLCYAVDTWEGDAHTDRYDDSIFRDVQNHAREHYRGFAYLMRMLFNDALQHFEAGSIDRHHRAAWRLRRQGGGSLQGERDEAAGLRRIVPTHRRSEAGRTAVRA